MTISETHFYSKAESKKRAVFTIVTCAACGTACQSPEVRMIGASIEALEALGLTKCDNELPRTREVGGAVKCLMCVSSPKLERGMTYRLTESIKNPKPDKRRKDVLFHDELPVGHPFRVFGPAGSDQVDTIMPLHQQKAKGEFTTFNRTEDAAIWASIVPFLAPSDRAEDKVEDLLALHGVTAVEILVAAIKEKAFDVAMIEMLLPSIPSVAKRDAANEATAMESADSIADSTADKTDSTPTTPTNGKKNKPGAAATV